MSITVKPISAQLLKNLDFNSKQDPYCSITVGQQNQLTSVHKEAGLHPVWDDVLVFNLTNETEIVVKVYDKDLISDDFIGQGSISIESVMNSKLEEEVVNLVDKKENHAGSIMMKIFIGTETKEDIENREKNEGENKEQNKDKNNQN